MSTHGRSGFSRLVTGSVTTKILHQLSIPVMLVRPFEQKSSQLLAETFSGVGEPYSNRFRMKVVRCFSPWMVRPWPKLRSNRPANLPLRLKAELHLVNVSNEETQFFYGDLAGMGYLDTRYYEVEPENEVPRRFI